MGELSLAGQTAVSYLDDIRRTLDHLRRTPEDLTRTTAYEDLVQRIMYAFEELAEAPADEQEVLLPEVLDVQAQIVADSANCYLSMILHEEDPGKQRRIALAFVGYTLSAMDSEPQPAYLWLHLDHVLRVINDHETANAALAEALRSPFDSVAVEAKKRVRELGLDRSQIEQATCDWDAVAASAQQKLQSSGCALALVAITVSAPLLASAVLIA